MTYNDQSELANNVIKEEPNQARKRNSAIMWYNPPSSMNVKTNTGKTFFKLVYDVILRCCSFTIFFFYSV